MAWARPVLHPSKLILLISRTEQVMKTFKSTDSQLLCFLDVVGLLAGSPA